MFDEAVLPPGTFSDALEAWIEPELASKVEAKGSSEIEVILELAVEYPELIGDLSVADRVYSKNIEQAQSVVAAWSQSLGARDVKGLSYSPLLKMLISANRVDSLSRLPHVKSMYVNNSLTATRVEGGSMIGSPQLQAQYGAGGRDVGVAIFDTGIDVDHPELSDRVVAGISLIEGGDPFADPYGHGTAVAGIVHAMAPEAHLFAVKVLGDEGYGTEWSVAAGFDAVYANRNSFGGIHVINASLGHGGPINKNCDRGYPASIIIGRLFRAGVAIVFSSGNDGFLNGVSADACHSKVIAVGAVYDADIGYAGFAGCADPTTRAKQIACYSNSGRPLDVLAPAHNARTTAPGGGYTETFGGTSAAAPYVSGVIAQLKSRIPYASPARIRSALMSSGTPIRDANGIVRNLIFGPGVFRKLGGWARLNP